jgi:hypothetical protein
MNLNFASNGMEKLKIEKIKYLLAICTAVIVGCHGKVSNTNDYKASTVVKANAAPVPVKKDTVPAKTAVVMYSNDDSGYVETMADTTIIPKKIHYNLYDFHSVTLGEPFNCDSALIKLYPGNYYKFWKNSTDSVVFEAWSCKSCTRHRFRADPGDPGYYKVFPLRDSNETQIGDTILFIDSAGKRSIIISFGTTEFEDDFIGMGNGDGPFMGLALFTEENHTWQLKAFNPGIGCYGSYQVLPDIHPFKFGKNSIGCYLGNPNQGAGSPMYVDLYMFGVFDSTFKTILTRESACRGNRDRNIWDVLISVDSTKTSNGLADLTLTTDGDYSSTYVDLGDDENYGPEVALKEVKPYTKHKNNFNFTIKSHYIFLGSQYKLVNEDVTTRPYKTNLAEKGLTKYYWGKVGYGKLSRLHQ